MVEYSVAHALNAFAVRHDGFEDALGSFVAASEVLFAAVLVVLWFAVPGARRPVARRAAVAAAASFVVAVVVAQVVGQLVGEPRPFVAHAATIRAFLPHAADPGFPSDHATAAFAIAVAVGLRRRSWGVVLALLAAVVAVGRVFLGLHYPGDVLAGALLGTLAAVVLYTRPARAALDRLADGAGALTDRAVAAARGAVARR